MSRKLIIGKSWNPAKRDIGKGNQLHYKLVMDFKFKKESASVVIIPESDRAKQWTLDNLQVKDWQTILTGIRIDPELISDIKEALSACGLSIT